MKHTNQNSTKADASTTSWQILALTFFAVTIVMALPEISMAEQGDDVFSNTLCGITSWFHGSTGKAIATIAIIFLGIAAFFGKVTWGLALMFAVGIFAIFGSSEIITAIAGDKHGANSTCGK